jgi:hypothetical protein
MRRILPIALVLLAVTAAPANAAKCKKHKGETVVARSSAAIVTRAGSHVSNYVYRGCLFSRGRRYRLFAADSQGYPYEIDEVEKTKLSGPYVALAVDFSQKNDTAVELLVTDLRNGRQRGVVAGRDDAATAGDSYTLERLALSKHGAVAWRGRHDTGYPVTDETTQIVTIADSHGTRVLDSGPSGSLGGPLFKNPSTVAWSHDGGHNARAYYGLPRD